MAVFYFWGMEDPIFHKPVKTSNYYIFFWYLFAAHCKNYTAIIYILFGIKKFVYRDPVGDVDMHKSRRTALFSIKKYGDLISSVSSFEKMKGRMRIQNLYTQ